MDQRSLQVLADAIAEMPVAAVIDHVERDADGTPCRVVVDYANAAAGKLFFGSAPRRRVSSVGMDLLDVLPGESGRLSVELTIATAVEGRTTSGEWSGLVPAGQRSVRFVQAPLVGDHVISWFEDLDEARSSDEERDALLGREADLRLALEATQDGLVILRAVQTSDDTTAYRVDLANRRALELDPVFGTASLIGHGSPGFGVVAKLLDRALRGGARETGVRRGAVGGEQMLALTVDPMNDGRLLLTARDITEQMAVEHRAAEASQLSVQRLNLMTRSFDAIPERVAVFRHQPVSGQDRLGFALELVNLAGERVAGRRGGDNGASVEVVWPFARSSGLLTLMEAVARTRDTRSVELPVVLHRGAAAIYRAVVAALDEESVLVVLIDVTELRRASSDLVAAQRRELEAERSRGLLVEAIAHELRTPLTTVVAVTDLLADTELDDEQRRLVSHQLAATRVMLHLIDDTLNMRRIEAGQDDDEKDFSLRALLEEVRSVLEPQASARGVELVVEVDPRIPDVLHGRGTLIEQVLVNLGGNALKFTTHGSVTLLASRSEADAAAGTVALSLEVVDTGPGIAAENLDSLFQRFQQGGRTDRRQHSGSGLGLAIVRGIVEALRGQVNVESQLGQGTTVTVELTLAIGTSAAPMAVTTGRPSPAVADDARRLRVLLAEDEDVNRVFVAALLTKLGADVDTAADGIEALDAFLDATYDLVLLDVQMPRRDGIETVTALRAEELRGGQRPTRVVALTASPTPEVRADCLAAGMDGVLGKPVSLDELTAELDRLRAELPAVPE